MIIMKLMVVNNNGDQSDDDIENIKNNFDNNDNFNINNDIFSILINHNNEYSF